MVILSVKSDHWQYVYFPMINKAVVLIASFVLCCFESIREFLNQDLEQIVLLIYCNACESW